MGELTHKEKDELIKELKAKLKEMKSAEAKLTATAEEMSQSSVGVHKDASGKYSLVVVKYDVEKNAAVIDKLEPLETHDFAIATYKAKEYLVEKILRKARGDKYVG